MKKLLIGSLIINGLLLIGFAFKCFELKSIKQVKSEQCVEKKERRRIAIMTPTSHPSLEQIQQGFENTMHHDGRYFYECDTYNANGNRILMRSQIEDVIQKNYDLIFTIATGPTCMAKEVTVKKQKLIPIVFGAVNEPVRLKLVVTRESSENHLTGVTEEVDYKKQLDVLLFLKPNIRKLLLVYNPSQGSGLEKDKQEIEIILQTRGIELKTVEVYQTNEVYHKASMSIANCDAVMILKDNTVVAAVDGLVKLCNRYKIPLFSTELDSVAKGVALGFGVKEFSYGVAGARKAKLILEEGKHPSDIPVTGVMDFSVNVNKKAIEDQGLQIAPELLFLITSGDVIGCEGTL